MIGLSIGAATDVGRRRSDNQDCALVSPGLVAVADGMGGARGGETASLVALQALRAATVDPAVTTLSEAVQRANAAVYERSNEPDLRGMGTTICALSLLAGPEDAAGATRVALANVGDSRIYLLRVGELVQVSQDHNLVDEMLRSGHLSPEEALVHPQRNVITRAIGSAPTVEVDAWEMEADLGDRFLLCSDGLVNEVDEARISAVLRRLADPEEAAHELVRLANAAGGRDNITCVVADVVDSADRGIGGAATGRILGPTRTAVGDVAGFTSAAPAARPASASDERRDHAARSIMAARRAPEQRAPWFTWRTGAFLVAVLGVFVVAALAVAWYGRGGYFVGVDADGEVAVFQGRPGGLLWFDPTLVSSTGVDVDELTPVLREQVEAEPEFASFDEARAYIENLAEQLRDQRRAQPGSSTTSPSGTPTSGPVTATTSVTAPTATTRSTSP